MKWNKRRMYSWFILIGVSLIVVLLVRHFPPGKPSHLGFQAGRLADCPASPNCVCTQASSPDHRMNPIAYVGDLAKVREQVQAALNALPRTQIITAEAQYFHAESTSFVFRFIDDVEVYIDTEQQQLHFRSAARLGHADLGVNRRRMNRFREHFLALNQSDT